MTTSMTLNDNRAPQAVITARARSGKEVVSASIYDGL